MGHEEAAESLPRYRAFISYSHTDARRAHWLHRKLETSRLPDGERLAPIFIDRAELAAGDLTQQVREALAQSAALVVMASPAARASRWVDQEIALFRQLAPDRPIFCALIDGEPEQAFPRALLEQGGQAFEPLAADFRKGKDGSRLGLLKIVAGLSGEPLDRLVQRETQTRARRVMAVTAGLTLLSLILAALLVWALRQRAEAQRQRAEAEGMVEFMLTDLRDRLKGVGRLDVMDAVNKRAMEHYASETDLAVLPPDSLQRRAKLLTAMGEDDFEAGDYQNAKNEFIQSHRITNELLSRQNRSADRIYNHAQNEFWLGNLYFELKNSSKAREHWILYLHFSKQLTDIEPESTRSHQQFSDAEANICALNQTEKNFSTSTINHCRGAVLSAQKVAQNRPFDIESQLALANDIAWLADAVAGLNDLERAASIRLRQKQFTDSLTKQFPHDARIDQARMLAEIGLAKALKLTADLPQSHAAALRAKRLADQLTAHDPKNLRWIKWRNQIDKLINS